MPKANNDMKLSENRKKKLEKEIKERREELYKLTQDERRIENQKLVGQCFKYMNSFGFGEHWPLYFLVTRLDGTELKCFRFQKDSRGTIEINFDDNYSEYDSSTPITRKEFEDAWKMLSFEIRNK